MLTSLKRSIDWKTLERLVSQGESDTLEFKKTSSQLDRAGKTICGFLNHRGGHVLIGVADNGRILGQTVSDGTLQEIAHMLGKLEPPALIDVEYVPVPDSGNKIIVFEVQPSPESIPYTFDGRPYQVYASRTLSTVAGNSTT